MEKPEIQVLRFDSSVETLASCGTHCDYQCGSQTPGCDAVCTSESCITQD